MIKTEGYRKEWKAMKGNLILIHGGGPTAVSNASLAGAIRQAKSMVDGGVVDRVPIAAARELGADFVIGVDVGYRGGESPCDDLFKIILHSMEIMEWQVMQRRVGEGDFVLAPSLLEINPASMAQAETCIRIGREEMQRRLPELQEAIEKKKAELAARQK